MHVRVCAYVCDTVFVSFEGRTGFVQLEFGPGPGRLTAVSSHGDIRNHARCELSRLPNLEKT